MTAPIGRLWIKDNVITGWIKFGNKQWQIIRFAAGHNNQEGEEVALVYPSKKKK